ncbi:hypothetical protein [Bacteroides rodentium]|uniref:hypothetical protein n=1 Tax=Bacteroides rodentium TaxID=691816 RepID=UPI0004715B5D|nr:hypothetical protein [Bacteroides rodentium]
MPENKLYVVNYADATFEHARRINSASAVKTGKADTVLEYSPEDIQDFITAHPDIFKYKRGFGLWAWKPYVIYDTLQKIEDGAWMFYCDSGAEFINDIHYLINQAENDHKNKMVFQLTWASAHQYTKSETFEWMGYDDRKHFQVLATCSLWQKTPENLTIVKEWLDACCEERLISPKRFDESIPEDPEFISHREDQSIFDIVIRKHGIRPYRDPSDYGLRSYFWQPLGKDERKSDYPVIILSFRRADAAEYKKTYFQRYHLWRLCLGHYGIYRRAKKLLIKAGILRREPSGLGI